MQHVLRLSWLRCTQMHESHDKRGTAQHTSVLWLWLSETLSKKTVWCTVLPGRVWSQVGVLRVPCHFLMMLMRERLRGRWERENCSIGKYIDDAMHNKIQKPVLLGKPACHYSGKVGNSLSIVCQEQNACNPAQIVFWDIMHYLCTVPWQAPSRIWPDWHLRSPFV